MIENPGMPWDGFTATKAIIALGAGLLLGAFFFWALWWTSQRVLHAKAPALVLGASFVARMAVLLGGIWVVTRGRLPETVLSVTGVLVARFVVVGAVRRSTTEVSDGGDQAQP